MEIAESTIRLDRVVLNGREAIIMALIYTMSCDLYLRHDMGTSIVI